MKSKSVRTGRPDMPFEPKYGWSEQLDMTPAISMCIHLVSFGTNSRRNAAAVHEPAARFPDILLIS